MKKMYFLFLVFFSFNVAGSPLSLSNPIHFFYHSSVQHTSEVLTRRAVDLGTQSSQVKIYPNPTQGNFIIEIELEKNTEIEVTVFNAIGIIVHSEKIYGMQGTFKSPPILFEDRPAGVYFVHIKAGPIKSVERLIKIK